MKNTITLIVITLMPLQTAMADQQIVTGLLKSYQVQGAKNASATTGKKLWVTEFTVSNQNNKRSCSSCHTANLKNQGKHIKTGKTIKAMAPSVNQQSLSKTRNIKKWFKRNCKWTMGRECTAQEKADLLSFINQQ